MKGSDFDIIYVDDERKNLDGFKAAFRRSFRIALAHSAEEGFSILSKYPGTPVILSDQKMPGINGTAFLEKVARDYPDSIRILITGYADLEATIEAINKGQIFYYIAKPINPPEVGIILQKALDTYNLQISNKALTKEKEQLLLKSEREEKELLKAQLQNLRSHINPHFLFNSLNILSALITDNDPAKDYVLKLSHVYRYLLKSANDLTSTLSEELKFTSKYIFLQQVRFTEGLKINMVVDAMYHDYLLPSYSMQIVIENIFKHNAVSTDFPMEVNIYLDSDATLVITNTLNPKQNLFESTGTGQLNLLERYKLLSDKRPRFVQEESLYKVFLPLLPPKNNKNDSSSVTGRRTPGSQ